MSQPINTPQSIHVFFSQKGKTASGTISLANGSEHTVVIQEKSSGLWRYFQRFANFIREKWNKELYIPVGSKVIGIKKADLASFEANPTIATIANRIQLCDLTRVVIPTGASPEIAKKFIFGNEKRKCIQDNTTLLIKTDLEVEAFPVTYTSSFPKDDSTVKQIQERLLNQIVEGKDRAIEFLDSDRIATCSLNAASKEVVFDIIKLSRNFDSDTLKTYFEALPNKDKLLRDAYKSPNGVNTQIIFNKKIQSMHIEKKEASFTITATPQAEISAILPELWQNSSVQTTLLSMITSAKNVDSVFVKSGSIPGQMYVFRADRTVTPPALKLLASLPYATDNEEFRNKLAQQCVLVANKQTISIFSFGGSQFYLTPNGNYVDAYSIIQNNVSDACKKDLLNRLAAGNNYANALIDATTEVHCLRDPSTQQITFESTKPEIIVDLPSLKEKFYALSNKELLLQNAYRNQPSPCTIVNDGATLYSLQVIREGIRYRVKAERCNTPPQWTLSLEIQKNFIQAAAMHGTASFFRVGSGNLPRICKCTKKDNSFQFSENPAENVAQHTFPQNFDQKMRQGITGSSAQFLPQLILKALHSGSSNALTHFTGTQGQISLIRCDVKLEEGIVKSDFSEIKVLVPPQMAPLLADRTCSEAVLQLIFQTNDTPLATKNIIFNNVTYTITCEKNQAGFPILYCQAAEVSWNPSPPQFQINQILEQRLLAKTKATGKASALIRDAGGVFVRISLRKTAQGPIEGTWGGNIAPEEELIAAGVPTKDVAWWKGQLESNIQALFAQATTPQKKHLYFPTAEHKHAITIHVKNTGEIVLGTRQFLGEGTFKIVWRVNKIGIDTKKYALLLSKHPSVPDERVFLQTESDQLQRLGHHNISALRKAYQEKLVPVEVFSLPGNIKMEQESRYKATLYSGDASSLRGVVQKATPPKEFKDLVLERLSVIRDAARAVSFLHTQKGLAHMDIKPANIFLTFDSGRTEGVLGDINPKPQGGGGMPVSLAYLPPENMNQTRASFASDVWALNMSLYELIYGDIASQFPAIIYTPGPGQELAYMQKIWSAMRLRLTQPNADPLLLQVNNVILSTLNNENQPYNRPSITQLLGLLENAITTITSISYNP